jgi:hypothetical protein
MMCVVAFVRFVSKVRIVVWSQLFHKTARLPKEMLDGELANAIPDLATNASFSPGEVSLICQLATEL